MTRTGPEAETNEARRTDEDWVEIVRRQVGSLSFGIVQIVVHGARVVQIERTEKVRLIKPVAVSGEHE